MINCFWVSWGRKNIKLYIQFRINGKGEDITGQCESYDCLHVQPTEEVQIGT